MEVEMNRTNQAMSVIPIVLLAFFFAVVGVACLGSSVLTE